MAIDRTRTRADLTYLRRRAQRAAPAPVAPEASVPAPTPGAPTPVASAPGSLNLAPPGSLSLTPPGSAPTPTPAPPEPTPASPAPSLNLSAPASSGPAPSLNLSAPAGSGPAPSLNLSAPASSGPAPSLNLSPPGAAEPTPATPAPTPPAPSQPVSLSLSHPGRPPVGGTPQAASPTPTAPTPAAPAGAAGSPLTLSSIGQAAAPVRQAPSRPPSRRVIGRTMLSADEPTVTLDRRQSAVGSLIFEIDGPGAVAAFWELQDGTIGLVDERARTRISPEFGRRPIVELHQSNVVVGLRHVQQLRRLLILITGFSGDQSQRVLATLHDEATFESTHSPVGEYVAALAIYNVDGELVVRREGFGFASTAAIETAYDVKTTWLPPVHRPG